MGRTRTERWDLKSTVYMWSYSSHWGYKTVCLFYEGKGFMVWWMSRNYLRGLFMLDRLMHCLQHSAWRQTVWSVVWHSKVQELCTKNTERNVFRQMHKSGYFWLFFFQNCSFSKEFFWILEIVSFWKWVPGVKTVLNNTNLKQTFNLALTYSLLWCVSCFYRPHSAAKRLSQTPF